MHEPPRLLGVVPARGGSKRLPRKNVLPLGGRPLIAWTIDAARASARLTDLLVSTDDEEIAAVARVGGAKVPWRRPAHLCTDTATTAAVLQHALDWYEAEHGEVDAVVLLQPTSPFRSAASIRAAIDLYVRDGGAPSAVVSVSPAASHPAWCFTLQDGTLHPYLGWDILQRRSQDLAQAFVLNGAVYVLPASVVRAGGPLLQPGARPLLMDDAREALDIDTAEDFRAAQALAESIQIDPCPTVHGR
jgi:CMP-N,N'-diacetyllegionaminic acid synthase